MKQMPDQYTILQLSNIFQVSKKCTLRYLKAFDIPLNTKPRFTCHIKSHSIKLFNMELYNSIYLTVNQQVKKPFYTIRDLAPMFNKSHSGMYRWLRRHEMPVHVCGNKHIILASDLLNIGDNKDNLRHFRAKMP